MEVLTSFFLEAGFLGIMLFGMQRVGPRLHYLATCLVAFGTLFSSSWILASNSWMQTPAGVAMVNGRLSVVSWRAVIFNPSWPVRWPHMVSAAYLTASFLVAGVGAYYLLKGEHLAFAKKSVALGTAFATVLIGCQVFLGDILYGTMLKHQPSKMQAAEGFWEKQSQSPAPYYWFIVPDGKNERNRIAIGTPYLGSIWLTHSMKGRVEGLKNTPPDGRPAMGMVFYGFRLMYVIAILMFTAAIISLYLRRTGRLFETRWFLRILVWMTPSGVLATLGGWYLAETGRQPWVVYGVLRTADAVSPVPTSALISSFIAFVCIYSIFVSAFLFFSWRLIRKGPLEVSAQAEASGTLKHALQPQVFDKAMVSK